MKMLFILEKMLLREENHNKRKYNAKKCTRICGSTLRLCIIIFIDLFQSVNFSNTNNPEVKGMQEDVILTMKMSQLTAVIGRAIA